MSEGTYFVLSQVTYSIFTRPENSLTRALGFLFQVNATMSEVCMYFAGSIIWAPGIIGIARRHVLTTVLADHVYL